MLRKISFFFIVTGILFLLVLYRSESAGRENPDQCVACHTGQAKMKALITRFPALTAEEGEG